MLFLNRSKVKVAPEITITRAEYEALMNDIEGRLEYALAYRNTYIHLFRYIDREYYGYLHRDQDDAKREKENILGSAIKPTDEKLPLIFSQLDECLTYLLNVLAPDEAMYTAQAPQAKQKIASGFAALLNKHAEKFHHYRHLAMFLQTSLRYNLGAYEVEWQKITGNRIVKGVGNAANSGYRKEIKNDVLFAGNALCAIDPYNLLIDPTVAPVDVAELGSFYAVARTMTPFRIRKQAADAGWQNVDEFLATQSGSFKYYERHPRTRTTYGQGSTEMTDWVAVFSAREESADATRLHEVVKMPMWLIPSKYGLSDSKDYEIWEAQIGNGGYILHIKPLVNAHAMLPLNISVPFEDHFQLDAKGAAERLIPHQRFASFVMNVHQRSERKRLVGGLTIYDENIIPALSGSTVDLAGGKVPANGNGNDIDLRKAITQFSDAPDTTNSINLIDAISNLMQDVLPTNIQNQVAGLDRATQYQAAAVVQGASRRNLKMAKIINAQAMDRGRYQQMQNVFQFQDNTMIIDEAGNEQQINPYEFLDADIEFTIADGLKGIDRLALTLNMKEMFNSILQSQTAAQNIDVVKLMDYMTTMFGDHTDMSQFKVKTALDNLSPEEKQLAAQLFQMYQQQQAQGGENGNIQQPPPQQV